jgi:hypothetical protein
VAIAHPHARLGRGIGQHLFIERQRRVECADAAIGGGSQIGVAGIVGIFAGHLRKLVERLGRAVGAIEDERQVGAGRRKRGVKLDGAAQQVFRVAIAADAPGQFGKQADRAHVERVFPQQRAQQWLGLGQAVGVHRAGGGQQAGIVDGARGQGHGSHRGATPIMARRFDQAPCAFSPSQGRHHWAAMTGRS